MSKARNIKYIIIHCSASDDSLDIGYREIKHLHTAPKTEAIDWSGYKTYGREWSDIGYHYIVRKSGKLEKGRPDWQKGAHVKGWNRNSIGMVWVGRNVMNSTQYATLLAVTRGLMNQYNVKIENVLGHYEINHMKPCPNIDMLKFRADLLFIRGEEIGEAVKEIIKL